MVTSLPRVHVVLMGIEKLIPTLADLDRFLKLLPRSATGQKLSAYTSLVSGPRRAGDDCGPEAMHVVLLDNGRSTLMASEQRRDPRLHPLRRLHERRVRSTRASAVTPTATPTPARSAPSSRRGCAGSTTGPICRAPARCAAPVATCVRCVSTSRACCCNLRVEAAPVHAPRWLRAVDARVSAASCRTAARVSRGQRGWRVSRCAVARVTGGFASVPGPAAAWTATRDLRAPAARTFQERWRERQPR